MKPGTASVQGSPYETGSSRAAACLRGLVSYEANAVADPRSGSRLGGILDSLRNLTMSGQAQRCPTTLALYAHNRLPRM